MTGYSGTPLAAKLGIKPGMVMRAVHAPKDYRDLVAPLPEGARLGYVDIKVCAVSDVWSGLKLVVRREQR